jgi:hypothetical protein
MKKYMHKALLSVILLMGLAAPMLISCDDENGAPPMLERISLVPKDSTTESGFRGNTYVIFGKNLGTAQHVYFNGAEAPLNLTMVRNDNIIVRIGDNTPYSQALNKVRVVTNFGEAVMDFVVKQRPVITSFAPAVASAGETVTIVGDFFEGLEKVKFIDAKTNAAVDAEIVSSTGEEIKVKVPAGTKVSYIAVETPGGIARSASTFGFNYVIYADAFTPDFENWSWDSQYDYKSTVAVKSGQYSYKQTYTGSWGGVQFNGKDFPLVVGSEKVYTALKISVYGGPGTTGKQLGVLIKNGNKEKRITLTEGVWTDFTISLSELGNPTKIDFLVLQDIANTGTVAPYLLYIDDLGLI